MCKYILSLIFFLVPSIAFAQDSTSINVEEVIYLVSDEKDYAPSFGFYDPQTNMWTGGNGTPSLNKFKLGPNGVETYVGFNGKNLREYISDNPAALYELDRFKKKKNTLVFGIGMIGTGLIIAATSGVTEGTGVYTFNYQNNEQVEKEKITGSGTLALSLIGIGTIVSMVSGIGSQKHVGNAIEIYNRGLKDPISDVTSVSLKVNPVVTEQWAGASFRLEF